jgi:hypothetical protein
MLGKLLKYEFKAVGRVLLPFYGALIAVALIIGVMIRFSDLGDKAGAIGTIIAVLIVVLYVVLLCIVTVMTLVLIVQRFSRNLLGSEGYLMLTLPTSIDTHIWNKTISAMVWTAISGIAGMLTLPVILFTSGAPSNHIGDVFAAVGQGFAAVSEHIGSGNLILLIIEIIALMLVIGASFALQVYASISIGHQSKNHKGLCSLGAFIGLVAIQSIIESVLGINGMFNFDFGVNNTSNASEISSAVSQSQQLLLMYTLFLVAISAVYYLITRLLMKYKLNLE